MAEEKMSPYSVASRFARNGSDQWLAATGLSITPDADASPLHRVVMSRFRVRMDHDIGVKQSHPAMYRQRRQL